MNPSLTRRKFVGLATAALAARVPVRPADVPVSQGTATTAEQVVQRIRAAWGPSWRDTPTDRFHAGDPSVSVTGVATTVMSTFKMLQQAAKERCNLILTHEPTFYTGNDNVADLGSDPMYRRKIEYIEAQRLVVFRFHDNWHARRPEPMGEGLAQMLGWSQSRSETQPDVFVIPPTTVRQIAAQARAVLGAQVLRLVGQPDLRVTRVGFLPGTPPSPTAASRLMPRVDLVIAGEQREWEGIYYAHDTAAAGEQKAMLVLGHAISEDPGMKLCADWLRTFIDDMPVRWIPAGEPFTTI